MVITSSLFKKIINSSYETESSEFPTLQKVDVLKFPVFYTFPILKNQSVYSCVRKLPCCWVYIKVPEIPEGSDTTTVLLFALNKEKALYFTSSVLDGNFI